MTIADIIRNGSGSAGSNRAWVVETDEPCDPFSGWRYFKLYHYGTLMLAWRRCGYHNEILTLSTGNGSVSDQGGMNTAFRVLGAPHLYFSRKGGARIINLDENYQGLETVTELFGSTYYHYHANR